MARTPKTETETEAEAAALDDPRPDDPLTEAQKEIENLRAQLVAERERAEKAEAGKAEAWALLNKPAEQRPTKTKLVRVDDTHASMRFGGGTITFQPRLHDPNDPRPHRIMENDEAAVVMKAGRGQYASEVVIVPEPKAEAEPVAV